MPPQIDEKRADSLANTTHAVPNEPLITAKQTEKLNVSAPPPPSSSLAVWVSAAMLAVALAYLSLLGLSSSSGAQGLSVADVQGPAFLSGLNGASVSNLTGIVTAKYNRGFFISDVQTSKDTRVSSGLYVFTTSTTVLNQVNAGDSVSLSGRVTEFLSSTAPNDLTVTELSSPTNIVVHSSGNTIPKVVLGKDRSPPTQQLSALDLKGGDGAGFLSVPNNVTSVTKTNATLQPDKFGLDFWESLEGQRVVVNKPVALDFENQFGEFWVRGDWNATGVNGRGSLTITVGPDGIPDANPEVIIVGTPLDGTDNPETAVGMTFETIEGIITFQFGFFYILPLTAPKIASTPDPTVPPTTIAPSNSSCLFTVGDYNIENFAPNDTSHVTAVAQHIASSLKTPDIMFVQEIQDNTGPTDDGTVDANVTLATLTKAIASASGGVQYSFIDINPVNDQDGGQPGGNIRQAYLYRPDRIRLAGTVKPGGSLDSTAVTTGADGKPGLTFNPGRIDPTNSAWVDSRKSLVALWEAVGGTAHDRFWTINVHHTAKGGSSSTEGDARPPVNLGVDQRTAQVQLAANFAKSILAKDANANIVLAGDFNEFVQTFSVFKPLSGVLQEADEVAGITPVERYTYVFDQNTEQLDHVFISKAIASRGVKVEHVHVNSWAPSFESRVSDHDPSVMQMNTCAS